MGWVAGGAGGVWRPGGWVLGGQRGWGPGLLRPRWWGRNGQGPDCGGLGGARGSVLWAGGALRGCSAAPRTWIAVPVGYGMVWYGMVSLGVVTPSTAYLYLLPLTTSLLCAFAMVPGRHWADGWVWPVSGSMSGLDGCVGGWTGCCACAAWGCKRWSWS
jgi:hypothetical protein